MGIRGLALLAGLLVGLSAAAEPALAQQAPTIYSHNRYYLGISGLTAFSTGRRAGDLNPSTGVALRGGGRVHEHWAVEVQGEWNDRFDFDGDGHLTSWAATAAARGYVLTGRIQPYGILGAGVIEVREMGGGSSTSDMGFVARGGFGVDYYLTRDLALSLSATYSRPVGDPDDYDFVTLSWGIQWH
ncbi:MAG: outer membrane beta-barrel protein [Myxococcota bacterium]